MKNSHWQSIKKQWFTDHPQDYYNCHYCRRSLTRQEVTLDHMYTRNHPQANDYLVPCCLMDNSRKGSVRYEAYCAKYYPHLLDLEETRPVEEVTNPDEPELESLEV